MKPGNGKGIGNRPRKPSLMMLLLATTLALLPLLAVLQYRWLGEVSRGERDRMRVNLEHSVAQFCRDFDRELTEAFFNFQSNVFDDQGVAASYRRWMETARHPQLIETIYQTRFAETGGCELLQFNPATRAFEPVEWPASFFKLRDSLNSQRLHQQQAENLLNDTLGLDVLKMRRETFEEEVKPRATMGETRTSIRIQQTVRPALIQVSVESVDANIPALVIPVFSNGAPTPAGMLRLPLPIAQRIVTLDMKFIKGELLPTLVKRHFAPSGEDDYRVAIVKNRDRQSVVYESEPGVAVSEGDVAGDLLQIRMNEASRAIIAKLPHGSAPARDGVAGKEGTGRRAASIMLQTDVKLSGSDAASKIEKSGRTMINLSEQAGWRVAVRHRAGSLEAAVASVRRRNLAISFGILALLGASVGFIVLSSRRAQALAERQMEFVAGVSHELRTPLAVICSAAENLADGVIDHCDQIKRYGGLIRDEGRRLTGMVEQVLEFAGAQSGRRAYELHPVELHRVIEDAVAACRLQLAEGGFELETRMPANLPAVNADAAALGRAIQNLLGNAMKYSGDSRWIGLSVDVAITDRGDEVRIKVEDRGIGIAPSELPRIFEPFYRGADVTAAQIHGNGLGLSLVKHIVEAHDGRVSVESKPREKTAFTLHLPIEIATTHSGEGV